MKRLFPLCAVLCLCAVANAQDFAPHRLLVQFRKEVTANHRQSILKAQRMAVEREIGAIHVHVLKLPDNASEEVQAEALRKLPEVIFAERDRRLKPSGHQVASAPNDPGYGAEWYLTTVNAPAAWTTTIGSSSVIIAVVDTGIESAHPDLAGKLIPGYNAYANSTATEDQYNHGTASAGIMGAASNNGIGMTGVTWNCPLMPIKVDDGTGYAYWSTVATGVTWAADHGARVANVNYEITDSATVQSAAQYLQGKGGIVIAPSGNDTTFDSTPANPYIVTVGATDQSNNLCSWSNTGNTIALVAPGSSSYTLTNESGYGYWAGTCFSSATVAGAAALIYSAVPGLTPAQVADSLKHGAHDLGTAGWDTSFGYGELDIGASIAYAKTLPINPPPPPAPTVTALTLSASSVKGGTPVTATVTIGVAAGAAGAVITITTSGKCSAPASITIPAGALSITFTVSTQRTKRTNNATITATSGTSAKSASLSITP